MRRLITFLVRKRLGLNKYEQFRFIGQKTNAVYYFGETNLMKFWRDTTTLSGVSLNWLLDENCLIERVEGGTVHVSREENL